jgi:hypothetical protein
MLGLCAPTEDSTNTTYVAETQSESASMPLPQSTRPPKTKAKPPARFRTHCDNVLTISIAVFDYLSALDACSGDTCSRLHTSSETTGFWDDSPAMPARLRALNIAPRAGLCVAKRMNPTGFVTSSYIASMPPPMKYVSCQKPAPPESRRKCCHQILVRNRSRPALERFEIAPIPPHASVQEEQREDRVFVQKQPIRLLLHCALNARPKLDHGLRTPQRIRSHAPGNRSLVVRRQEVEVATQIRLRDVV